MICNTEVQQLKNLEIVTTTIVKNVRIVQNISSYRISRSVKSLIHHKSNFKPCAV